MRKKRKMNELVGAKNRGGAGHPKEKRQNQWLSRGKKQGAWRANLKKIEKTNGL